MRPERAVGSVTVTDCTWYPSQGNVIATDPREEPMGFTLELTEDQAELRQKAHSFARCVTRPVAAEYAREQHLPWPVLQQAARQGLYGWELYAGLVGDPTGLSLPILMEELFWGCAGIGLTIVL